MEKANHFFSRCLRLVSVILIVVGMGGPIKAAYAQPKRHRLVYHNMLAARHNPWGLVNRFSLSYQYRLYQRSGVLWDPAFVGVSIAPSLTPASVYLAAALEITPIAFLQLRLTYGFYQIFGVFRGFQSFPSPTADFSDQQLQMRGGLSKETGSGGRGGLSVLLQGKVGPFAVRNELQFHVYNLRLREGDTVFYDIFQDILITSPGWLLTNDSDLLYLSPLQWMTGLRASALYAFYPNKVFNPGESTRNPTSPYFRLGPILGYTFRTKTTKRFQEPTLLLHLAWNVLHPNRAGQSVSQVIPTTFLAFTFQGELWGRSSKKE